MLISQISVFIENKAGRLRDIIKVISKEGINIRALSIADTTDFGILRIIVSDPNLAEQVLKRAGMTVNKTQVIAVEIKDEPGSLEHVLDILCEAEIGVEYSYAFVTRKNDTAYVIFRVENNEKAIEHLTKNGINLLKAEEAYKC